MSHLKTMIRFLPATSIAAMLSACQPTNSGFVDVSTNGVSVAPPAVLATARNVNRDQLSPLVQVDGTAIDMVQQGGVWTGQALVQPNNTYDIAIEWNEALSDGPLRLAQLTINEFFVGTDGAVVQNLGSNVYSTNIDDDGDGFTNLVERENESNAFDIDSTPIDDTGAPLPVPPPEPEPEPVPTPTPPPVTVPEETEPPETDESETDEPTQEPTEVPIPGQEPEEEEPDEDEEEIEEPEEGEEEELEEEIEDPVEEDEEELEEEEIPEDEDELEEEEEIPEDEEELEEEEVPEDEEDAEEDESTATVVIPRISASNAPDIDGLGLAALASDGSLIGEWSAAVQVDENGVNLGINNLMIDFGTTDEDDGDPHRRWAAMHDGTRIYILVLVDDVGLRFGDSDRVWEDDALELFIDGDNSKLTAWGDDDDFQFLIPMLTDDGDANISSETGSRFLVAAQASTDSIDLEFATGPGIGPDGIRVRRFEQDVYELSFDIDDAGITIGEAFGLELQVDDDDNGSGRDAKWGWFHPSRQNGVNTDTSFQNPSIMGTVVLDE